MKIRYHKNFLKNYEKRIASNIKLAAQFKQRFVLFQENPRNPLLKDHRLSGRKSDYRSFSITGDVRAVYKKFEDGIFFTISASTTRFTKMFLHLASAR